MTQPEAARVECGPITKVERFTLGMAALLERQGFTVAANELRRLHAQRDALLAACRMAMMLRHLGGMLPGSREIVEEIVKAASAAIAKAEENT